MLSPELPGCVPAPLTGVSLAGTMWASCCNWFCVDGSPEEMQPPPAARAQAYSNPGYSSFPSPTASEQSCKACGMHFDSSSSKVSPEPALPAPSLSYRHTFCTLSLRSARPVWEKTAHLGSGASVILSQFVCVALVF